MTHYDVDYSGMSEIEKHNKAIQDIKDYIGEERFDKLTKGFRSEEEPYTLNQFAMLCSFAGIQGYPVKAWYNYCFPL